MVDAAKSADGNGPLDIAAKDLLRAMVAEIANGSTNGAELRAKGNMGVLGHGDMRIAGYVAAQIGPRALLLEDWVGVIDTVGGIAPDLFLKFMSECERIATKYAKMELDRIKARGN